MIHAFSYIQGGSGGKDSILGAGSIGNCEKESSCDNVSGLEWLTRYSCLNVQDERIVNGNKQREIAYCYLVLILI